MSVTVDSLFESTWKFLHHFVSCHSFQRLVRFMIYMVGSLHNLQDEMKAIHKVDLRGLAVQHLILRKGAISISASGVERYSAFNLGAERSNAKWSGNFP